jgi:hypothetical protein
MTCKLWNYLELGSNPRLHLECGKNGPDWGTFNIDYQGSGNIPCSDVTTKQWVFVGCEGRAGKLLRDNRSRRQ